MSYSVNGARPTMMDTVIDGVTASFPTVNGFTGISVFPSVDAIQEFKVLGANYPAEYGRSLGSVLNVVYKSGHQRLPWQRIRVLPRLGLRRQQLLRQAGRTRRSAISAAASSAASPAGPSVATGRSSWLPIEGLREQRQCADRRRPCRRSRSGAGTFRRRWRRTAS